MQRSSHDVYKARTTHEAGVFAQPTRASIAAALAAQRREREVFAKVTGNRVNRDGRMSHAPRGGRAAGD